MAAIDQKKGVDGLAVEIIDALKTSFQSSVDLLGPLKLSCTGIPDVKTSVLQIAADLPKSFGMLTCVIEARDEACTDY